MANSFLSGVAAANNAIQVDNQTAAEDRRAAQQKLKNFIAGYEQNPQGDYVPNASGQQQLDITQQVMEQQAMQLQAENQAIKHVLNAQTMTDATTQLFMGNQQEANRLIANNPILKQQLHDEFGAVAIKPVDLVRDRNILQDAGITVDDDDLKDPVVVNALNSYLFKTINADGTETVRTTPALAQSTNYQQYVSPQDKDGITQRVNKINEILTGHVKSKAERALKNKQEAIGNIQADMTLDTLELTKQYRDSVMHDESLSTEEKLNKLSGIMGKSSNDIKAQIEAEKLKKAKADTKVAEDKANNVGPVKGEAEFISNLDNPEKVPFDDATLHKAKAIQGKRTPTAERNKEVNGRFAMAKAFDNFTRKFMTANINRDALSKVRTAMDKIIKPGMTGQEQEKVLNNIEVDTELRALLAEYVKFMSGAAVTTEEYNRYNDIVQSGVWSSKASAEEALRSFSNYLRTSSKSRIDSMKDLPYDYLIKRHEYNSWADSNKPIERAQVSTKPDSNSVFNKFKREYR